MVILAAFRDFQQTSRSRVRPGAEDAYKEMLNEQIVAVRKAT